MDKIKGILAKGATVFGVKIHRRFPSRFDLAVSKLWGHDSKPLNFDFIFRSKCMIFGDINYVVIRKITYLFIMYFHEIVV